MLVDSSQTRFLKINGTQRNDKLFGSNGNDTINAGAGNDYVDGLAGNDLIYGGDGNDIIWGNDGNDTLYGENGNDFLHGGRGNDVISGGAGNDTLYEFSGTNYLWGNEGSDTFILSGGKNIAAGGEGNDSFLSMGDQNATLAGGIGNDTYSFGIDLLAFGDNPDPMTNPTGTFVIRENFKDKNWGTIYLSSLNLEWINPTTGKTPYGSANTAKNDVWVSQAGPDIIYDIKYNDGGSLKIILEDASSVANTIGSHVIFSMPR